MVDLGVLAYEQGDLLTARQWYTRTVAAEHPSQPTAMRDLGVLEYKEGNVVAARRWYTQAAATDHPDEAPRAMVNLGDLEHWQGDLLRQPPIAIWPGRSPG